MKILKTVQIIGLGALVWSLTLLWPELDLGKLLLGSLGATILVGLLDLLITHLPPRGRKALRTLPVAASQTITQPLSHSRPVRV